MLANKSAGGSHSHGLIGQARTLKMVKAIFLGYENVGYAEHSSLDLSRLQGTQPIRARSDLHDCDILYRNQSDPLQGNAGHRVGQPAKAGDSNGASFELYSGLNLRPTHEVLVCGHKSPGNHNRIGAPEVGTNDRRASHLNNWGIP